MLFCNCASWHRDRKKEKCDLKKDMAEDDGQIDQQHFGLSMSVV